MKKLLLRINKNHFYFVGILCFIIQSSACCLKHNSKNEVNQKNKGESTAHTEIKKPNTTQDTTAKVSSKKDSTTKSNTGIEIKHQSSNQHLLDSIQNKLDKEKGLKK